jgi:hypothetical protein
VCEIAGKKDRTKSIRFDVRIVKAVRIGSGKSVPVPADFVNGDTRRFHFVLQDKPDLTCELDTPDARDVALSGFVYVVSTRRHPLYGQGSMLGHAPSLGKGNMGAMRPSQARGVNARCLTGWNRWYEAVEKGMLRTRYKPRLLLLTNKYELEIFSPPNDSKDKWPADMIDNGPLKQYLDGRWSADALEDEGFTYLEDSCEQLASVQAVTAVPGKAGDYWVAISYDDGEKPTLNLRVPSQGEQRYLVDYLNKEMRVAKSIARSR